MPPSTEAARSVTLVEVGPRDGLQNENRLISTADKLGLIDDLAACGLTRIEVTAFVSPKWVPQMADHDAVMRGARRRPGLRLSALVPNARGADAAIAAGAQELAIFTSASETFSHKNTNCSIAESLERFVPVVASARAARLPLRAYISCACDCPYEGPIAPGAVADLAQRLLGMGEMEIVLSDTIGRATPDRVSRMIAAVQRALAGSAILAAHFHDTSGRAIENAAAAWDLGIRIFDGSAGGLGGCPYAPGAAGNVDTAALAAYFERSGIATGIELDRLRAVGEMAASWRYRS
jgi:hydroxymethylglutaryl-CoA lyase